MKKVILQRVKRVIYLQSGMTFTARSLEWRGCHGTNVVSTGVEEHEVTSAELSRVARLMQRLDNLGLRSSGTCMACGCETGSILHDTMCIEVSGNLDALENHC